MSLKLKEFRNNIQIGELRRNIQFIVVACLVNKPPVVTTPDNIKSKSVCAGDTVTFDFSTTDPDTSDTLNISWNEAITGAKWTNNNGQQKHPAATFSWVPSDAHVSSLPYTFSVTAKDNACPVRGSSTISCQVYVKPKPRANIIVIDSGGGDYWFIAQRIEGSGPVYQWEGENFTFTPNTGSVVWHKFTIPGIYPYTMEMVAGGCTNTYYDTIFFDTTNSIFETAGMEEVFIVYPNPAKEYFNIRLKDPSLLISGYKLYNASGELVKLEDEVFSREYQIACKSLEKGSYFISIRLNNGKIVNKQLVLHQ